MALYRIEHLTFAYPQGKASCDREALRDVSFEVCGGSFTVLCGASGCGKTTLLRLMKTALAPHGRREGDILFDGCPLDEVPLREQTARIGFVMQIPEAQLVTTTVRHELAFGLENLGVDPDEMRLRMAEMACFFGIEPWFRRSVDELSGGQKQLLNLAAVMAMHPDVLLLDEPTAQLDPIAASNFLGAVAKVNRELGCTVVMAEHRLEDVLPLADQVIALDRGSVVAQGGPRDVARMLWEQGSPVAAALPTPARVALAVGEGGDVPLTVREGREWLKAHMADGMRGSVEGVAVDGRATGPRLQGGSGATAVEKRDAACIDNLWFRYGREESDVLRGASLTVPEGAITALMGANGAGKSTLLQIVAGTLRPYRGSVRLGRDARVALLPQDPRWLFAHDSVARELEEMRPVWERAAGYERAAGCEPEEARGAKLLGMRRVRRCGSREAAVDEVRTSAFRDAGISEGVPGISRAIGETSWVEALEAVVERCALTPLVAFHPLDLSGGEQQRVALAKVLLARPRVLLLDEPTKSLDARAKEQVAALLRRLADEGVAILLVSHDVEFCARYADRVALLFDGEVVSEGSPRQFFAANSFYTTAANRMSRGIVEGCITEEDVVRACRASE